MVRPIQECLPSAGALPRAAMDGIGVVTGYEFAFANGALAELHRHPDAEALA